MAMAQTDKLPLKITWQAREYEYHPKNANWYWVLGIIALALVLAAVVLNNFLFAVLVVISGFALASYGARKPHFITHALEPRGIRVGKKIYDYGSLKFFWIHYDPPIRKELLLESKKTFANKITIMLEDADPEQARDYLLQYLKEKKIEEPLTVTIARLLKI